LNVASVQLILDLSAMTDVLSALRGFKTGNPGLFGVLLIRAQSQAKVPGIAPRERFSGFD
jgi:hypothetical protein